MNTNRWRTVDIVVAAVIAVAFGVVFLVWNNVWETTSAFNGYPPLRALLNGVWLIPAVLGPLVIRKPGAGLFTETVAAVIEALAGSLWGLSTILYGAFQGLAGEVPFAATGYRTGRLPVALLSGAFAGAAAGYLDVALYYPTYPASWRIAQIGLSALSGLVVAGLGGWALTKALGRTGVLDRFPSGRERVAV
jgi:energy-coupling factor transport system substrate-specific component